MYVIAYNEEYDEGLLPCYWTCRFNETDNYSVDIEDATEFKSRGAGLAMIQTLGTEHYLVEVCT